MRDFLMLDETRQVAVGDAVGLVKLDSGYSYAVRHIDVDGRELREPACDLLRSDVVIERPDVCLHLSRVGEKSSLVVAHHFPDALVRRPNIPRKAAPLR